MTVPTFDSQRRAWSRPPVDDVGYISSSELLKLSNVGLRDMIANLERVRYRGWRNHDNLWREVLGLDDTRGLRVLDYGCGVGVVALQYARNDNRVWLADIVLNNLRLARRVLEVHGYWPEGELVISGEPPFTAMNPGTVNVIHCVGVLHHIPEPRPVVDAMHRWLAPDGELRLMLYSDNGWRIMTGTEPPDDVTNHPEREKFVRGFDSVGDWADWYDEPKVTRLFGDLFVVDRFRYLTPDWRYIALVLRRKDP